MDLDVLMAKYYRGKGYSVSGNKYEGLEWWDDDPKPTKEELEVKWLEEEITIARERKLEELHAYSKRKDILSFEFQVTEKSTLLVIAREKALNGLERAIRCLDLNGLENGNWQFDDEYKTMKSLTVAQLKDLFTACFLKDQKIRENKNAHKKNIFNLTSVADIKTYDFSSGW